MPNDGDVLMLSPIDDHTWPRATPKLSTVAPTSHFSTMHTGLDMAFSYMPYLGLIA